MRHIFRLGIACLFCIASVSPAFAAPPKKTAAPTVIVAHKGGEKFMKDIEAILKLTTPKQQKQWKVLKAQLDLFLKGVDRKQPLRMDFAIKHDPKPGESSIRYRPAIPVTAIKQFVTQNLKPSGVPTIRQARDRYKCTGNVYKGYMRHWTNKAGVNYAVFNESLSGIRAATGDPRLPIAGLLAAYDMGGMATNQKTDANAIKERRKWVSKQANELLAALKRKKTETEDDFALRKLIFKLQFEEAERFYAEGESLKIGWNMNLATMTGRIDLNLKPIAGTDLAKAINMLGTKPSHFAGVPRSENTILSLRINHPLDDLRKEHGRRFFEAMYHRHVARINADTKRTAKEKQAQLDAAKMVMGMLEANLKAGLFDVFAEVHPNKGKHTVLSGFATADGRKMVDVLKLVPDTHKGAALALKVATQGDVEIHKVTVKPTKGALFDSFLGGNTVYVGTSKDGVWFASGPNALIELTKAIKAKSNPPKFKADDPFVDIFVRVAPWLDFGDKLQGAKRDPKLSKLAHNAFKGGNDGITLQLRRKKTDIVGNMDIQTDVLRFVGAMTAKFSEETLDESNPNRKKTKTFGSR